MNKYSRVKGTYSATNSEKAAVRWTQDVAGWKSVLVQAEKMIEIGHCVEHNVKNKIKAEKKLAKLMANNPFESAE